MQDNHPMQSLPDGHAAGHNVVAGSTPGLKDSPQEHPDTSRVRYLESANRDLLRRIDSLWEIFLMLSSESLQFADRYYRAPVGYVILNDQGVIIDCNPGFASRFLLPAFQLRGSSLVDRILPQYRETYIALLLSARRFPSACDGYVGFSRDDRQTLLAHVVVSHCSGNSSSSSGEYRVIILDGFNNDKLEMSARQEREKANLYFEIAGVIMMVLAADGTVSKINQKGTEVLECPAEMLVGKNWFDTFLPMAIKEEVHAVFDRIMAGDINSMEYFENPVITPTGKEKTIAWRNTLMRDEGGTVFAVLSSGIDVSAQRKKEAQLRLKATVDPLTGVLNRREGIAALEAVLAQCRVEQKPATICLIDLNNLKYINDHFGHLEGDEVIVVTARIFTDNIKKTDVIFRIGGDEFIIIFKKCNMELAEMVLDRIDVERKKYNATSGKPYDISWCHGIEEWNAQTIDTLENLIRKADEKMYRRKNVFHAHEHL